MWSKNPKQHTPPCWSCQINGLLEGLEKAGMGQFHQSPPPNWSRSTKWNPLSLSGLESPNRFNWAVSFTFKQPACVQWPFLSLLVLICLATSPLSFPKKGVAVSLFCSPEGLKISLEFWGLELTSLACFLWPVVLSPPVASLAVHVLWFIYFFHFFSFLKKKIHEKNSSWVSFLGI